MTDAPGPTRFPRAALWLDSVERLWMGRSFPPPNAALVEEAWTVDEADNYCQRCGNSVGPGEATDTGCARCRKMVLPYAGVVRLGRHDGALRDWLLMIKYHRWPEMADHLGRALGEAVREHPRFGELRPAETIIVPIPMPWLRRVYRGIDHARVLAGGAGAVLGAPVWSVLTKSPGPPQTSLTRSDRTRRRAGGWITPRRAIRRVAGLDVVLVDDIRTTGATLRIASRLLKKAGAERILVAVAAVADEPGRGKQKTETQKTETQRTGS